MNGEDKCKVCNDGYILKDGECFWKFWWIVKIVGYVLLAIVVMVVLWIIDLAVRPVTNQAGLDEAQIYWSRMKLHQPLKNVKKTECARRGHCGPICIRRWWQAQGGCCT